MYNEQFFQLFEAMAGDGELTSQEIEVLRRSGEAMGIDGDKFAIYFEARMVERLERLKHQPGGEEQVLAIMKRFEAAVAVLPANTKLLTPAPEQVPHEEAGPEQHEEIGKCPACKETINGLNHVCPSCGLIIDADHDTHGSLEEMLEDQEQLLLQAKVQSRRAAKPDLGLAYLVVPFILICLGSIIGQYGHMGKTGLALWVVAFVVYRVQRKSHKAQQAVTAGRPLPELEDAFEKNDRQIALFFGDDARVGQALHTLRQQMAAAKAIIQAKSSFSLGRVLVRVVLLLPILIPWIRVLLAFGFPDARVAQIKDRLKEHNLIEAHRLLEQLPASDAYRPGLISEYKLAYANVHIDSLQSWLLKQKYPAVQRGLLGLQWDESYSDYSKDRTDFETRKRQLNAKLPPDYRLMERDLTAAHPEE